MTLASNERARKLLGAGTWRKLLRYAGYAGVDPGGRPRRPCSRAPAGRDTSGPSNPFCPRSACSPSPSPSRRSSCDWPSGGPASRKK
ncbi:MAG: hypothetical protein M0C28_27055 [Candidatus Moduliflexus flocculans]|nr:hypothetical protein [Candidatus Moduliflexus flocculans]